MITLRGYSISRIIFPFLCQAALDWNASCDTLRFVVVDAIYFSFQKGRVTCDESYMQLFTQSTFGVFMKLKYK